MGLIMTYGNLIKNKIQHIFNALFDRLLIKRKLTDDQIECIQFGICDYAPRKVEDVPFFITEHSLLNLLHDFRSRK